MVCPRVSPGRAGQKRQSQETEDEGEGGISVGMCVICVCVCGGAHDKGYSLDREETE